VTVIQPVCNQKIPTSRHGRWGGFCTGEVYLALVGRYIQQPIRGDVYVARRDNPVVKPRVTGYVARKDNPVVMPREARYLALVISMEYPLRHCSLTRNRRSGSSA
jgi:hypothetical protein